MRDIEFDSDDDRPYECYNCGTITVATENPGDCPSCGAEMRNRQMPFE